MTTPDRDRRTLSFTLFGYSPMADVSALGETAFDGSTFKFAPDLATVYTAQRLQLNASLWSSCHFRMT